MTNVKLSEKQKEVINGNKLIAEFDGWKYSKSGKTVRKTANPNSPYRLKDIQYHSSWDWLMPVYIKIVGEELYGDNEDAIIIFNIMYDRLGDGDGIEEVWKWIVKFIQWYNIKTLQPLTNDQQ